MRLIIRNLSKIIGEKSVIKNASYTFEQGRVYGLTGRKNAGKTTLMNCISGEYDTDGGYINLGISGAERKVTYVDVGCAFHNPALPGFMTGIEFIRYYMDIHKELARGRKAEEYLKEIGIDEEERNYLIRDYSKEIKNKLQLLCIKIAAPKIILLDNPVDFDDKNEFELIKSMLEEMKDNHIIIYSSPDYNSLKQLVDEIIILNDGILRGADIKQLENREYEEKFKSLIDDEEEDNA